MIGELREVDDGFRGWMFSSIENVGSQCVPQKGSVALVIGERKLSPFGDWMAPVLCCGRVGWVRIEGLTGRRPW